MKADLTRRTFDPRKQFSEVLFQQGRVQLDADLNEQQEILRHATRVTNRDVIGWSGVPKYGGGFRISPTDKGEDFTISPGRIYVDGVLCVAETAAVGVVAVDSKSVEVAEWPRAMFKKGDWFELRAEGDVAWTLRAAKLDAAKKTIQFDPVLKPEDLAKIGAPPKATVLLLWSYRAQPDLTVTDPKDGTYLAYLDVWERLITPIDDSSIREKALGGPDTAARTRIVWQVRLEPCAASAACKEFGPDWRPKDALTNGMLNVRTAPVPATNDPCLLPGQAGYRGLENQLYRVEIHQGGKVGHDKVTFKWSRDNGSVTTAIDAISGSTLTTSGLGPDDVRGFSDGQWVEIMDDATELAGKSGQLVQIETADRTSGTIVLKSTSLTLPSTIDSALHYKLRRWDSDGSRRAEIPSTNDGWIPLENGIEVQFSDGGIYRVGDYWLIPARTAMGSEFGSVEWPQGTYDGPEVAQPPAGIRHRYAPLALLRVRDGKFRRPPLSDCRIPFPPLIETGGDQAAGVCTCCSLMVGDGVRTHGDFDDIQEALLHLPEDGGELCLLPGDHRVNATIAGLRNVVIKGCGLRTMVSARSRPQDPVFTVVDSSQISFSDLCIVSFEGVAIALDHEGKRRLFDISIANNLILGFRAAVHVQGGEHVSVRDNHIRVLDRRGGGVGVYLAGRDSIIERNEITLSRAYDEPDIDIPGRDRPFNPQDDCAEFEPLYRERIPYRGLVSRIFSKAPATGIESMNAAAAIAARARGGIHIAAGSERIRVRDNHIHRGTGNGITLGGWSPLVHQDAGAEERSGSQQPQVSIEHEGGLFSASVRKADTPVAGTTIQLTSLTTANTRIAVSDQEGTVRIPNLSAGHYSVTASSPGLRVSEVREHNDSRESTLVVEEAKSSSDQNVQKLSAFLREIVIDDNRIYGMGLSGIASAGGTVRPPAPAHNVTRSAVHPALQMLELYGNPIVHLVIARNEIVGCLNTAFTEELRMQSFRKGLGGISLGICEDLTIVENTIEHNGLAPNPVAAIFLGYGEHVDISLNRLQQNGAVPTVFQGEMLPGTRGGIVVVLGSCLFEPEAAERKEHAASLGQYAIRIHGNSVSQPVGRSLALGALGPVSVQDNDFDCHAGLRADDMGGAVLIVNLGRALARMASPGGTVLMADNQSRVGAFHTTSLAHVIISNDDVSLEGNQLRTNQSGSSTVNAVVWSATARVRGNRLQEPMLASAVSVISWARQMNSTEGNQGDHCIFAYCHDPTQLYDRNQVLAMNCDALGKYVAAAVSRLEEGRTVDVS